MKSSASLKKEIIKNSQNSQNKPLKEGGESESDWEYEGGDKNSSVSPARSKPSKNKDLKN